MKLFIKSSDAGKQEVEICGAVATVDDLKRTINSNLSVPVDQQRLIYRYFGNSSISALGNIHSTAAKC